MKLIKTKSFLKIFVFVLYTLYHFIFFTKLSANERDHLFNEGNRYYQEGEFQSALESYQKILNLNYESAHLYYNIGNVYYKLNDIAHAILYYERAKKIIPGDEDLKNNLALANLAVIDKFEIPPKFIFLRIIDRSIHMFQKPVLIGLVLSLYIFLMGLLIIWILARGETVRFITSRIMTMVGVGFCLLTLLLIGRIRQDHLNREAIIMNEKVDVLSAPSERGGVGVFSLHQGTKVRLDQKTDGWIEIICPDRKVGWVKQEVLEVI